MAQKHKLADPIVQDGDPVLRAVAAAVPVKDITSRKVAAVIARMQKALHREEFGVAIAAPQIGESLRIFVVAGHVFEGEKESARQKVLGSPRPEDRTSSLLQARPDHFADQILSSLPDRVFINPTLTRLSRKKREMSEGCLSVRGKYGSVLRHERVSLVARDEAGKATSYNTGGLLGHVFQHECDHLDGILYIDKTVRLEEDEDLASARAKLKQKHGI